jgi:hypothetical protein
MSRVLPRPSVERSQQWTFPRLLSNRLPPRPSEMPWRASLQPALELLVQSVS